MNYRIERAVPVLVVLLATLSACATRSRMPDEPRLGVQLWSVKDELKKDYPGTLARLASLGFRGVEFAGEFGVFRSDPAGLKAELDKNGLQCTSAHVRLDQFTPANFEVTVTFYRVLGCMDLIVPADRRAFNLSGAAQVAEELTALAGKLAPLGMRTGYHNHAEEMHGEAGQTSWDVLAKGTPSSVILQQDVGWTTAAGKDPVAYVRRFPGRSVSLHYKAKLRQGEKGIPLIGKDHTDWRGLTQAARSVGGTKWLIVEQEEYPQGLGQVDAVAASLRGLQTVMSAVPAP